MPAAQPTNMGPIYNAENSLSKYTLPDSSSIRPAYSKHMGAGHASHVQPSTAAPQLTVDIASLQSCLLLVPHCCPLWLPLAVAPRRPHVQGCCQLCESAAGDTAGGPHKLQRASLLADIPVNQHLHSIPAYGAAQEPAAGNMAAQVSTDAG